MFKTPFLALILMLISAPIFAASTDPTTIARMISTHHYSRPDLRTIPVGSLAETRDYLSRIDPSSRYYSQNEFQVEATAHKQKQGIGAFATVGVNRKIIIVPFQGGPAFLAGINHPIELSEIQGKSHTYNTLPQLAALLKDRQTVSIKGNDLIDEKPIERKITLGLYQSPSFEEYLANDYLIIRLYHFVQNVTFDALRKTLKKATRENKRVIVDLRYSAGGDLFEALDCVSLFWAAQQTLAKVRFDETKIIKYVGRNDVLVYSKELFIITSKDTASAAEVFARALQFHKRAKIIGQESQGKCTTQQLFDLPNGDGLKLTVGQILGPDDKFCEGKGIRPDISFPGNIHNIDEIMEKLRSVSFERLMETEP